MIIIFCNSYSKTVNPLFFIVWDILHETIQNIFNIEYTSDLGLLAFYSNTIVWITLFLAIRVHSNFYILPYKSGSYHLLFPNINIIGRWSHSIFSLLILLGQTKIINLEKLMLNLDVWYIGGILVVNLPFLIAIKLLRWLDLLKSM